MALDVVPDVLDAGALEALREELAAGVFIEGRKTASGHAAAVKHNLQLEQSDETPGAAARLLLNALARCERFRAVTFARAMRRPEFARYEVGMEYGSHLDAPIQGGRPPIRADLAVTVFLNEPSEYDGGELMIRTRTGEQGVKLAAGHAVVYPADSVHRVTRVTRGERVVAVTWVQSHVRDPQLREILIDLDTVAGRIAAVAPDSEELQLLARSRDNLMRKVAEF
jgi:PKHD-type hydroxylase